MQWYDRVEWIINWLWVTRMNIKLGIFDTFLPHQSNNFDKLYKSIRHKQFTTDNTIIYFIIVCVTIFISYKTFYEL